MNNRPFRISWTCIYHILHCSALFLLLWTTWFLSVHFHRSNDDDFEMGSTYGFCGTTYVLFLHLAPTIPTIVISVFNIAGLVIYNCFRNQVQLKTSVDVGPFVCFRIVTRGNFPELVVANAARNRDTCLQMGLRRFQVEVVTDSKIQQLCEDKFIKQIVVPNGYRTPKGSLYKARALQYALEDKVSSVSNNDWIVHLDEESLLTPNSLKGILNFVADGRYPLGQGLITYANEDVVNWFTTFMDAQRVADDLGKLQFQMKMTHRLLFDWKGSFLVCKAGVEKLVSFDNGPEGSIIEDICFGLKAAAMGFKFNFIEGEVWEKSPFTLVDFVKQRRRWVEGGRCLMYSPQLSWFNRLVYVWFRVGTFFIQTGFYYTLCARYFPLNSTWNFNLHLLFKFLTVLFFYMHILGAIKSYTLYPQNGWKKLMLNLVLMPFVFVVHILLYCIAFMSTLCTTKTTYSIVDKKTTRVPLGV